jgi:hypothetical protein
VVNTGFISGGAPVVSTLTAYSSSSLIKRNYFVENKNTYSGYVSSVVVDYLSLLDLRVNKNNGILEKYTINTKINQYSADDSYSVVPNAISAQDGLVQRNRLYYLATVSYQFWS